MTFQKGDMVKHTTLGWGWPVTAVDGDKVHIGLSVRYPRYIVKASELTLVERGAWSVEDIDDALRMRPRKARAFRGGPLAENAKAVLKLREQVLRVRDVAVGGRGAEEARRGDA